MPGQYREPVTDETGQRFTWRRRALAVTAFLASAITLISEATSEYMLIPIQSEMSLSTDEINRLALLPDLAGIIAVFLAGALAVRFGRRRILITSALVFATGSVVVALAPTAAVLIGGRVLCGLGSVTLTVAGLSLINVTFTEPRQRARAFGVLGAITPAVFIATPPLSAWISDALGWRFVPLIWLTSIAILLALALPSVPAMASTPKRQELLTPLLAGLALMSLCVAASTLGEPGPIAALALAVAVLSTVVLVLLLRTWEHPTLDLRILRMPGSLLAVGAILMALTVNISFFLGLYTQYRYDLPLATTAILLALPEVAGIGGSLAFGALAGRVGAGRSATIAMTAAAIASTAMLTITATSPVWWVIAIAILVNLPISGAVGPLAENFLNVAPTDGSDAASAIHDAVTNVGYVLGGLAVGMVAFASFQTTLTGQLVDTGIPAEQATTIAADIRDGVFVSEIVDRSGDIRPRLFDALMVEGNGLNIAQTQALHIAAVILTAANLAGAGMLVVSARRRDTARRHPSLATS